MTTSSLIFITLLILTLFVHAHGLITYDKFNLLSMRPPRKSTLLSAPLLFGTAITLYRFRPRGRRGGRRVKRTILKESSTSSYFSFLLSGDSIIPKIHPASSGLSSPPSLYILNPTSLAKPHALQHLTADLLQYKSDVCLISETWFKKHHNLSLYTISGYTCYRRDRARRRGGGVAAYISDVCKSSIIDLPFDDKLYEILWIHSYFKETDFIIGVLYHPPKALYRDTDFLHYIERSLDYFASTLPSCRVIVGGDFNQLDHSNLLALGLQETFYRPTHRGHNLDRLYTTTPLYSNLKAVTSTVSTEHFAIVASSDQCSKITDFNKSANIIHYRKHTPQQSAALINFLNSYCWNAVLLTLDIQSAVDTFYSIMYFLLDNFFPSVIFLLRHVTPLLLLPLSKPSCVEKTNSCIEVASLKLAL